MAGCIDHTLLLPTTTTVHVEQLCEEAKQWGFYAVCVNPRWVPLAADRLSRTNIKVASAISLPLGADATKIKVAQARDAIFAGADEIDMVADLAAIIEEDSRFLLEQFQAVLKVCRQVRPRVLLKVIIESAALTGGQKIFACRIAQQAHVDFVKTSTGMHPAGGATVEDIKLMKEAAPDCMIKAAGGIRTAKQALEMLEAGAVRIGTSSGVRIVNEIEAG